MKYERLTKWEDEKTASINGSSPIDKDFANAINRLAELEDKIEDGRLVELPKIGDVFCKIRYVNEIFRIIEGKVIKIEISSKGTRIMFNMLPSVYLHEAIIGNWDNDLGVETDKYYRFTKEDAEAKLKELKGE